MTERFTAGHARSPAIVLVTGSLEGGGAERQMSDMANFWAADGLSITLATWSGPEIADFYPLDPRVRRVHLQVGTPPVKPLPRLRLNLRRVLRLRRQLVADRPDAVLSFMPVSNVLTILASVGLTSRVVVSERVQPAEHAELPLAWQRLRRVCYAWSEAIVVQTQDAARWVAENCGKSASVIPNALRTLPSLEFPREPLIVAVGRLEKQKGFDLLVRAFAPIAAEFNDWNVVIIGEGSERQTLERLRAQLRLEDRVSFLGQLREVGSWMARAGLVVQPSRFEGFPNVVLESMGMGAAVISADCPSGPSELIEDGMNGRLVPVEDVPALSRVMAELMSQPEARRRFGSRALEVRERFRQERIMSRWEACLLPGYRESMDNALESIGCNRSER